MGNGGGGADILLMLMLMLMLILSRECNEIGCAPFQRRRNCNHHRLSPLPLRDAAGDNDCDFDRNGDRLRSSYPPETPAGLRGEAVRSALVSTERCLGWNLSSNRATSSGGLLELSGRGTLEFLNGKLTRDFRAVLGNGNANSNNANANANANAYREACLLDAKGRVVDVLKVTLVDDNRRALVLTSPGHSSAELMKRLDPFIFPMDEVDLTNYEFCNNNNNNNNDKSNHHSFAFTLTSTQYSHVQKTMREQATSILSSLSSREMVFPGSSQGVVWKTPNDDTVRILVVPSTGLPSVAGVGYTFVFFGPGATAATLGQTVWEYLIGEANAEGPIEVGALEYETLRIEAGQPAFGHEFGIDRAKQREEESEAAAAAAAASGDIDSDSDSHSETGPSPTKRETPLRRRSSSSPILRTGPYDLYFGPLVDLDKGCYLGQEGVASVLKNPKGPLRTLYTVVFQDEFNVYESESRGDGSPVENLTTLPKTGQKLFALGSNEELEVGTLTSMGEAGGTGGRLTVGLALIRRADSIRKKMDKLGLEIERDADDFLNVDPSSGSGMIQPPPMDPLDGLEVIVEGTFTMGVLRCIPSRQSGARRNSNMFDEDIEVEGIEEQEPGIASSASTASPIGSDPSSIDDNYDDDDDDSLEKIEAEIAKAAAEAETAAAEARRKAEKMELLKKRAEEALARRKQKKTEKDEEDAAAEDLAAAEANRKAEKMAMLKKRADEALARRREKKEASSSADETEKDNI
eukprot:jgi/Psemu1/237008/estExt_Genewise1.C_590054